MDINALSLKQLKALSDSITRELRARDQKSYTAKVLSRLVPLEVGTSPVDDIYFPASIHKRFGGGFFSEKLPGGRTKGIYAKTKTGIVYKWHKSCNEWDKFEG